MITSTPELIERLRSDMRQAMKENRRLELEELRSLLACISNAEAVSPVDPNVVSQTEIAGAVVGVGNTEVERKTLSAEDVAAVLRAEIDEMHDILALIDSNSDYAADLRTKIAIVEKYL